MGRQSFRVYCQSFFFPSWWLFCVSVNNSKRPPRCGAMSISIGTYNKKTQQKGLHRHLIYAYRNRIIAELTV